MALAVVLAANFCAAPVSAQKMGRDWHEDTTRGFKFKPLDKYSPIPIQEGDRSGSALISKFLGPTVVIQNEKKQSFNYDLQLYIFSFEDPKAKEDVEGSQSVGARKSIGARLAESWQWLTKDMVDNPEKQKSFKTKDFKGEYLEWHGPEGPDQQIVSTYTFPMGDANVAIVYLCTAEHFKKYSKVFNKSVKTLQSIPIVKSSVIAEGGKYTYEEQLQIAEEDCLKTNGWKALPTPSKRFIIKTSSDDKGFLKEVIERLEVSRDIFEEDFPPPSNFDAVSIVRICSNSDEFSSYGETRPGVAGWFSPSTTELVLYDAQNTDRNQSFAVMSHEAFHQYCHFIFDESEAHRWFDEGHGDYYGGIKIKGSRSSITNKMPGGLNRLDQIKTMVRNGTYAPLKKHINFSHSEWQNQGPSNVSCYSQSWSIIYMLRQGALGKVSKKYWDDSYAGIVPAYVKNLKAGYHELRLSLFEKVNQSETKIELNTPEGKDIWRSLRISPAEKEKIWKRAMDASWGKVDLVAFEEHWLEYVKEDL